MNLWSVQTGGKNLRQLTFGETSYVSPDLDRYGNLVATRRQIQFDIWRYPMDGSPEENVRRGVQITQQTGTVQTPSPGPRRSRTCISERQWRARQSLGSESRNRAESPGHLRARSASHNWRTRLVTGRETHCIREARTQCVERRSVADESRWKWRSQSIGRRRLGLLVSRQPMGLVLAP